MAKEKKVEAAPTKTVGANKASKRNRELRRSRKALRHLVKRHPDAHIRQDALNAHIHRIDAGAMPTTNYEKKQRREMQEAAERAKRPASAVG